MKIADRSSARSSAPAAWLLRCAAWGALLICSMGASCNSRVRPPGDPHPVLFEQPPDLPQLVAAVHRNSMAVQRLHTNAAQLRIEGSPISFRSSIDYERPHRFHLKAQMLATDELDLGSNDEFLWVWGRHVPGAMFFARHDQYEQSLARDFMPLPPLWLIEALGVVTMEPGGQHQGPFPRSDGLLEVHTPMLASRGETLMRVVTIDPRHGWVAEQQVLDATGRLLARATAHDHRYYSDAQVSLPDVVDIQLSVPGQPQAVVLHVNTGGYLLNEPHRLPGTFQMPSHAGYPRFDLADPATRQHLVPETARAPDTYGPPVPATTAAQVPSDTYRPQYRGYSVR